MREIKFRFGWYALKDVRDLTGKREWVFEIHTLEELIGGEGANELFACYKTRDEYTGLHDKGGKEVYEGDIVRFDSSEIGGEKVVGEVMFNIDLALAGLEFGIWTERGFYRTDFLGILEVIGNIYENPELLELGPPHNEVK